MTNIRRHPTETVFKRGLLLLMLLMSFQVEMIQRKEVLILYKSLMGSIEPSQTEWFGLVLVGCRIRGGSGGVRNKGWFWWGAE